MADSQLTVLFLSSWYPTKENPTMGNFVQKHAEAVALYANVTVLHVCFVNNLSRERVIEFKQNNGVDSYIIYIEKPKIKIPGIREIAKLRKAIKAYKDAFLDIFPDNKPDIVHANILIPIGLIAHIFLKTKKIPYLITEHWTGYLSGDPNKPGLSMLFFRQYANRASLIAPVTENLGESMQSFGIKNKFSVISNVVDTDLFSEKIKHPDSKKHILHVSSLLDVQKNFSGILSALHKVKERRSDFVLNIISDGDFEQYRNQINQLDLSEHIVFFGKKGTNQVAQIMKHCDFLLLFSNYENFPCVIPEAWSCGLPVISTNVGGISKYLNPDNGIMIAPKDEDALVKALENMLTNVDSYDSRKIRNFAVNNFSYQTIGSQFIKAYHDILKN